jgi:serine/threonine protein kinase
MRVCPLCMRELLPSDTTCPDDGAVPVEAADQGDSGAPTVPRARRLGSSELDASPVTPAPLADQLEPGTMLGKAYRVERLIGHGGMGAVYEVEHLRLQKRFAAKVLRHEYAQDTTALARFEREAVAASRIHHPNIVEVVNMDETVEGRVFIVEELLLGFDLAQLTRGAPLPIGLALSIGVTVARALEAAHAAGIVHRDLKPANIFLARRNGHVQVKVLDFGISKIVGEAERASLTDTGGFVGTPLYMAPEQAQRGRRDRRAHRHLRAWGSSCMSSWPGRRPSRAKTPSIVALKHVMEAPEPLATRNTAVPGQAGRGGHARLAKAPADRPADMGTFADGAHARGGARRDDLGA